MKAQTGIVNIRGREYQTVALRVQNFREAHPAWTLQTLIIHRDEACVVMRCEISDESGRLIATGHAEEYRKASEINKTSALENCETSAIGRALAALGMGGSEFASADEVARAVSGAKGTAEDMRVSAPEEAWKLCDEDTQRFLRTVALDVTNKMPDADKALDVLEFAGLEADHKAALWHLLDSATRSAIKRASEARKQ